MVHLNINCASNKRKASDSALLSAQMLTRQSAFLQEPGYQKDIKSDIGRFKELNRKFGPFEVELFASKTNNLLLQFACIVQRWDMHRSCHVFFRFDNVLWSGCNCFSVCSYATHDLYFVVGRFLSVCWLHQIGAFFMLQCLYCLSVPGVFPHAGFCATCGWVLMLQSHAPSLVVFWGMSPDIPPPLYIPAFWAVKDRQIKAD